MLIKKLLFKFYQFKWIPKWIGLLGVFQCVKLLLSKTSKAPYLVLKLKGYDNKVYLRPKTSDLKIFKQIFIEEEYNVIYPKQVNIIIDAGSNCGYSIVYFKNKFKKAKLIAVEPDTSNIEMIKKNTSGLTDVFVVKGGIWNINTDLKIVNKEAGKWAFRVVETLDNTSEFKGYSLDAIMLEHDIKTIDILKMDIEGSEKKVFEQNYQYWLSKTTFGFLELHEDYAPGVTDLVHSRLDEFNFKVSNSGENLVFSKKQ